MHYVSTRGVVQLKIRRSAADLPDGQKKRREKLILAFHTVSEEIGRRQKSGVLTPHEECDCTQGRWVIGKMIKAFSEVLRLSDSDIKDLLYPSDFPDYKDYKAQLEIMRENDVEKLSHFLNQQLYLLKKGFERRAFKFPIVLELLHQHYNREEVVLPKEPAGFLPLWMKRNAHVTDEVIKALNE